jgi:terminase small subunit / prophage DNA-packing protein
MAKPRKLPAPPSTLTPSARARWVAVLPTLLARGTVDLDTFASYCQLWARWREAEDGIAKTGQLVKRKNGSVVASPLIRIAKQAGTQAHALEQRLGIDLVTSTPANDPPPANDGLLTRPALAQRLGHHEISITKWQREGLPVAKRGRKGKASYYREADVRAWLEAREAAKQTSGLVDVAQERARKERAQAELAEQLHKTRARELLPASEVEKIWAAEVQAVRAAILASYTTAADRVHRIAVLEGVAGVEAELKALAHDLLRELSSPTRELPAIGTGAVA